MILLVSNSSPPYRRWRLLTEFMLKKYMGIMHEKFSSMENFKKVLDEAVKNNQITSAQEQEILNDLKGSKANTSTNTTTTNSTASNNL